MQAGKQAPRIVVTGIGVVSPIGIGNESFWDSLVSGRTGIDLLRAFPTDNFPVKLAAEVRDFDPEKYITNKKFIKVMSRDIQLGVAAANLAVKHSGITPGTVDPNRFGVEFGAGRVSISPSDWAESARSCIGKSGRDGALHFSEELQHDVSPLWLLKRLPNMPASHISIEHDARGPNNTITSREPSALLALAEAVRVIERGAADCMIVGATSSNIHPLDLAKLSLYENLSQQDDPSKAYRPFDKDRDGTIIGEGSAAFIIETYQHAKARGADIFAEVLAVGAGCDGTGYDNGSGGTGLVRSIQSVLRQAKLDPKEIGHINAHGKSTKRDDWVEARAYHRALGSSAESIPVTALKSYFGNFDAGSGAVELAGSLLAMRHGELPATLNYETPDPLCPVKVVHDAPTRLSSRTSLTVNRSAMGQSAAAILRSL